jgi:hypothetical protein
MPSSALTEVIFDWDAWPYSWELHDALMDRLIGHEAGLLQEWVDRNEGTPEEKRFVADFRSSAWDADAKGPLYRRRGRSPGAVLKPLAPVERDFVEWVRAERKKLHGWLQLGKLPTGKIEELIERAFVRFPDAEKLQRKAQGIYPSADRPTDRP